MLRRPGRGASSDVNLGMKSSQDVGVAHNKDGQWRIEPLDSPEHQAEALRRLNYLTLIPKLALCCLVSDWLYLAYRLLLVTRAPRVGKPAYVVLSIEICFAGKSL